MMKKYKNLLLAAVMFMAVCVLAVITALVLPPDDLTALPDTPASAPVLSESDVPDEEVRLGPVSAPILITAADPNRTLTDAEKKTYPQPNGIPTLYIELKNGKKYRDIQHSVFSEAVYTLVDGDTGIVSQPLGIAGRGNYSWNMGEKKTYALSLNEKADLLGMGAARRWVLLSGYNDRTLMRNYMALTFSREIGMEYAPECRHIDLYFNGTYFGNYLLVEKIQINNQRVNIDTDKGGLFEIERTYRHGDCTYCIDCPSGVHVMYKSPDEDEIGAELKAAYLKKFKSLFIKADIAISKGYAYYSRYIDVDSFIDWYILNEFVKNYDSGFTTSCYCWADNSGIIHMGPVWDYDTCMGNQSSATGVYPEGYHVAQAEEPSWSSPWYVMLMKDETFFRLVCERWTELVDSGMLTWFFDEWYAHDEIIAASAAENFKKWPQSLSYSDRGSFLTTKTHEDEINYVVNFLSARYNWLCDQWYLGEEKPYRDTDWYTWYERGRYTK
ncbi:MAG: CotH kinase family protein [Clostridia bacterium]|nr:CotH kinase family protein [Clostridia bacterium]